MDELRVEVWVTSLVALATATLVALWNVGGWAALQRRTMRQELEIANALHPGVERRRLEQVALERATLYVHRRTFIGPSETRLRRLLMLTLMLPVVVVVLGPMASFSGIFWFAATAAFLLFSGLLGFWLSRAVRQWRARTRERQLEEARARLATTG